MSLDRMDDLCSGMRFNPQVKLSIIKRFDYVTRSYTLCEHFNYQRNDWMLVRVNISATATDRDNHSTLSLCDQGRISRLTYYFLDRDNHFNATKQQLP
ncbi:hypothetical protein J6590_078487 [Homalodisca vitripennis]|nr:hypothetical protein J6590_078487 [Homalodisca vitripennis]